MSAPLVARAELMSIEVSASVWSMTIDRRRAGAGRAGRPIRSGLDLIAREQRHLVFVEAQLLQVVRHDLLDEILGPAVHGSSGSSTTISPMSARRWSRIDRMMTLLSW
jgi:hypothetical protein